MNLVERALRIAFAARPELSCRLVERVDGAVLVPGRDDGALVEVIDLSDRPRAEQLLEAQHLADDLARTPIDPRTDGVARARLVSLADDSHRLVVAVHPVVADGASLAMAFDDFVQTYGALWRSGSAPEVGVAIDGDAVRRRRAVALDAREDVAAFWARVLPDDLEPLSLPRGRPVGDRPAPHGRSGEYTPCLIPPRLAREAREVAEGLNTSVFVVMLAALGLLVHRYGGHRLVPVTVPIDTRAPGEIHEFGAFTTALPVVVELDEDAPFADLVAALRDRYEQTRQHSVYPLGLLAEMTEARSGVVRPQVGARYYRHLRLEAQFGDVRIAFDPQRTTRADVDLQLEIFDHGDSLVVGFIQAAGTFDSATMARIAGHYRTVLASSLQNPHRRVGDVHVLTAAEERQIRFLWNRTAMPFPDDVTVHRLIEDAVADYPGAVAVSFRGRTLSYAEFNTAANRVAHRLRALGAGPGTRICVLLERSMEMPIALVGILKSGAAYVPIEPDLPPERIRYTIVDATAPVLVTVTGLIPDGIPDGVAVLCLDGDAEAIEAESAENPPASARPDDIAYVLYTSGSTGTPKAAQIRHVGVVNLIRWITDEYALGADDRILLKTPYSHDISVPEFFLPLTMSGTLVIAPPDAHRDPDELVDLITRNGVTVVHFVPTMLREFVGTPAVRNCGSLRHVFVGGEALTRDLIEKFSQTIDAQLHNVYGPTEATDYSTAWEVQPDSEPIAPIGRPIANMRTYVVDSAGRLVPVGVAGELCVAGVGVGAGYLNRPDLTAERFVDNPFEDGEGRLYRTGDICMWRADGTLEFVGRDDGQVKIRGHRVELGEVEAALLKQPAIAEAGVLMREDQPDVRRLVAYLVTVDGVGLPSVSGLRAWCETLVPEYAVPSVFIALPALPRTGSGKLDRRALPAPGAERPDLASEYVPPRTPTERSLAAIWGEVLGLRDVGVRDSFFELGGDSILAIRIVAAAKRAGLSSSVRQMFALDTIEAQASLGGQRPADQATTTAGPALSPLGWLDNNAMTALRSAHPDLGDAYPLTPMQQGMLFHSLRRPGSGDYVEQVLSVVDGIDPDAVQRAWVDVLIRHDALRTSVALTLGEPLAIVHTHIEPDVVHLDWTGLDPGQCRRELEALLDRDRAKDFDVLNPPLWRLFLAREDGGRVRCLWSHHHLLLDGWSVARLLGDVSAALPGDTGAEGAPALPLREHAAWLLKQDSAAALAFWSTELDGVTGGTGIGLPPPASASRGRGRVIRRIDRAAIDQFCRAQRVTTATMLQGAVALLLSRYTPTTDTVFGTVVSGRAIDLEGVDSAVGCLLNTIAVRIEACGELPVGDWLRGIQDRHAAALGHSHVALADVQRELGLAPDDDLIKLLLVFEEFHLGDGEQALREIETLEAAPIPVIAAFAASGDALELRLSYDRALYAEDAMRRVARHLHALLDGLSADADTALAEVPMLGEEERRLVTQTFNDTAMPLRPEPVHDLISAIDERRVALRFNGETTTFGALNGDANRLAHALRARGAGRDVAVAICMQRSPELVTAQLAVLRAGAAYLPLDPEYPVRRIETVLHDAQAPIVIVDAAGRARIAELADLENVVVVDVESDAAQIATLPDDDPETGVTLDDLAYILYTSGSTGEPKGVAQTHRTIVNMLAWIVREYGLGPEDRWLFKTPQTFDVSVPDVFFPLAFAGQMVIAPPGAHADPGALVDLITGERVSVVQFVPSMLDAFLDHPGSARCVSLRYVMAAGEQLRRPVVDRCLAALPGAELHNLYGPTETFYVTDSRCSAGSQDPPIGRPFANTRGYVLDRRGDPVPVGATGELWIAGAGVARGYLGRAELTAQRFVRDSFSGGQMYRTGDYARWRDDGELEYLGRIDDQVKFHGQRIELGEIEAAMRAHPGVERAAVAVSEGAGGQQRLVGYIVSGPGPAVDHAAVAATVAELVPRALVPTLWMTVDHLPVTTHGKLDRSALPAPPIRRARGHRWNANCPSCGPRCSAGTRPGSTTTSSPREQIRSAPCDSSEGRRAPASRSTSRPCSRTRRSRPWPPLWSAAVQQGRPHPGQAVQRATGPPRPRCAGRRHRRAGSAPATGPGGRCPSAPAAAYC